VWNNGALCADPKPAYWNPTGLTGSVADAKAACAADAKCSHYYHNNVNQLYVLANGVCTTYTSGGDYDLYHLQNGAGNSP
jgi:hypothetical protein